MVPHRPDRAERRPARKALTSESKEKASSNAAVATVSLERRLISAGVAGAAATGGAALLPFWPPGVVAMLAIAASLLTLRAPRAGLAVALFVPLFPLGNVSEGAAITYAVVALSWLALTWRDSRTGLAFVVGVVLAPVGLLALVPLCVQPVTSAWRRGLQAFAAVLVAALVAGLTGHALPLTGTTIGDLGIAGSERPTDAINAVLTVLHNESALLTTGLVLALVAAFLPLARARGLAATGALCGAQVAVILLWAPTISPTGILAGTCLLFAILAVRPALVAVHARRGG
jgi:hypothetical protein